jgi:hypothetical protein
MVQTIFAKDISLYELEEQLGLQFTDDPCFCKGSEKADWEALQLGEHEYETR